MWCGRCEAAQFLHTDKAGALIAWCDRRLAVCDRVCLIRTTISGKTIANPAKKAMETRNL